MNGLGNRFWGKKGYPEADGLTDTDKYKEK